MMQHKFKTTIYGHNTITYQRSKLWNNLPNDFKTLDSIPCHLLNVKCRNGLHQTATMGIVCRAV